MKLSIDAAVQAIPYYPKAALYGADAGWTRLASNENPYPPSAKAITAMIEAALDVNRYPESESEMKALVSAAYGIKPQNVCIGNGSNELIETALKAMRHGSRNRVIVHEPSFAFYCIAAQIYGYETDRITFPDLTVDLDVIARHIDDKTRLIFLNNPNNPTGTIFEDDAFRRFVEELPAEILVVVDEAYAEFKESEKFPKSVGYISDYPVLVLRTFSKAYGLAGLRVGYGLGEEFLISCIERTKQPFSVNMMALVAAKAALGDEQHLQMVLRNNSQGKRYFYGILQELGLTFLPTEANFLLVKIGPGAEAVVKRLFEKKVLVRWMRAYGLDEYIRVSIGTMDENRKFVEALKAALV